MKYRVKETQVSPNFSVYSIQRKNWFVWTDITVDIRYLSSLKEAERWITLKEKGFPVESFYYEH